MKTYKIFSLVIIGISLMMLHSCSSTSGISMEVLVPADIYIPQSIKKVAVVNRSLPAKGEGLGNFLEGFITGEAIFGDKDGSNNCVKGLVDELKASPRFEAVIVNYPQLKGTGTREWPAQLSWTMVDSICTMYKTDALVALETFDSDILFNNGKNVLKQTTKSGKDTLVNEFFSNLRINVNAGWRVYDKLNKKIIDEQSFMDEKAWMKKAPTADAALKQLPNKRDAINSAGVFGGFKYAGRISPTWANVYRSYYTKGKKEVGFKNARNYVRAKNWEQAVIIWTNLTKSKVTKNAGRAYYNLAVASEVDGNLDTALVYAKIARETYLDKRAASYINVLNMRIADQVKLKKQMGD